MHTTQDPVRALTIFLAKADVAEGTLVDMSAQPLKTIIRTDTKVVGTLYSKPSHTRHPSWVSFFDDTIDPAKLNLWSSSAAAVLVVPVKNRLMAVAFGQGRHLLNVEAVEDTFGLRVVLNCVSNDGIRSIDRKTFEGITTHVREQASKETLLSDFGINIERDLLRAVVGSPTDKNDGLRLSGMDALCATSRVTLASLPTLLERYLSKASDVAYKARYPWVDNITEVRDRSVVSSLEDELISQIRRRDFSRKWLAVPDLMDWVDVAGFRYTESEREPILYDIHFKSYMDQVRKPEELTVDRMRRHRVVAFSAATLEQLEQWSLFRCIYAEVDRADGTYLLNGGNWYEIDKGFTERINDAVSRVQQTSANLIPYKNHEKEAQYNRRLSKALGQSCLMDAKNISHGGGHSSVEFCDIFTSNNEMLHVKRYSGSSVLSHLFSQGTVAATAFVSDSEFRRALNARLPPQFRLTNPLHRPHARRYEVGFLVASQSTGPLKLPFFSRVTLRNAIRQLEAFGFRVTLTKVNIV